MNPKVVLTMTGVVLAVILLAGPTFIIKPSRQKLEQLHKQVDTLSDRIRTLTVRLVDIRRRSEAGQVELTQVQEQLIRQMDLLPTLEDIPELFQSIINRGAGLGLEFVSILPVHDRMFTDQLLVSSVSGRALCELPVQLRVRGRYRQLAEYLEVLGGLQYYSRINEVYLKRKERTEIPGLLEMTVNLNILYL